MKYAEEEAGVWIFPRRKGYLMACCDCGLIHRMDFRIKDKHIEFRCFRENRRTGQLRRHMNKQKDESTTK